ncbi:MAG: flagellar basal body rod protein FlgB [Pseudomonadota bacterium]
MADTNVFSVASVHADWLGARQTALSGNIANANVPGYRAVNTVSFDQFLEAAARSLGSNSAPASLAVGSDPFVETSEGVAIEQELFRAAEVRSAHSLNTAITSSFHSLFLAAARAQ